MQWHIPGWGTPYAYWYDFSLEEIIRYEATHFIFSAYLGFLAFWLMWTILSRRPLRFPVRCIYRISFLFGVCLSVTVHILLDFLTKVA